MFVLSSNDNAVYRVVAILVALAVLMLSNGMHFSFSKVEAANLTYVKDTLSDSAPGPTTTADHEIQFVIPSGSSGVDGSVAGAEDITVTFPSGFSLATTSLTDVDLEVNGTDKTLVLSGATANQWTLSTTSQVLTLTAGSGETVGAGATVTIKIGSNATAGGAGSTVMQNPSATGSYQFYITAGADDSGYTRVVILENVLVTASVDTVFEFTVTGFPTVTGVNVNGTSTNGTSTSQTLPFGTLTQWKEVTLGQLLNVTSNAIQGFVVTVEQDSDLQSATGAIIDSLFDGSSTNTPANWASPSNQVTDATTWGHWGLTSSDDLNGGEFQACTNAATEGCWVAASTTPRQIFTHNGPADGTTANIGSTTIGYQVEISPLQEAADDYSTTLTYIATPTF